MLVIIETSAGYLLQADNGGGSRVHAPRRLNSTSGSPVAPMPAEVFQMNNAHSHSDRITTGDTVTIATASGNLLSVQGTQLQADRALPDDTTGFVVEIKDGSEFITSGTSFALRTESDPPRYIVAEAGGGKDVNANRTVARDWETFKSHLAEWHPRSLEGPKHLPSRWNPGPYASGEPVSRGLMVVRVEYSNMPNLADDTVTMRMIEDFCFGTNLSLRQWVRTNSYGRYDIHPYTVRSVKLPKDWSYYKKNGETERWRAIARQLRMRIERDADDPYQYPLFVAFDFSGEYSGSKRTTDWVEWDANPGRGGAQRLRMQVISHGLYLQGGPKQGWEQLLGSSGVVAHELGHLLFDLPDRYSWVRRPARGDVVANRQSVGDWETFTIPAVSHIEPSTESNAVMDGDSVQLVCSGHVDDNGRRLTKYLYPERRTGRQFLIAAKTNEWSGDDWRERFPRTWFTLTLEPGGPSGPQLRDGSVVSLRTNERDPRRNRYVVAEDGGGREVRANREHVGEWERFQIIKVFSPTRPGDDIIRVSDMIALRTGPSPASEVGFIVSAEPDATDSDRATLERGWRWPAWEESPGGNGVGGGFDKMDDSGARILLSMWDRISLGFCQPRFVTPRDWGCYWLRPSFSSPDALLLWDPSHPDDYYVIEYRLRSEHDDEVPSSGGVISWTTIPPDHSPAVISAARSDIAPDPRIGPVTLAPRVVYKRHDRNAAFSSGEVRLPLGNGAPSNFLLSFHSRGSGMVVCLH